MPIPRAASSRSSSMARLPLWLSTATLPGTNWFDDRYVAVVLSTRPRQLGPTSTAPAARTRAMSASSRARPAAPASPRPAVIATIARAPLASTPSTASSKPASGTAITARSIGPSRSATDGDGRAAEDLAAAAVHQLHAMPITSAKRLHRDGIAPLGRVGAGADDGDRGRVEQRAQIPAHFCTRRARAGQDETASCA